ncbi:MAG: hypothetical protein KC910_07425 [Candidatus Eremiobacteraeota bacterium]|nr:hypothetical protein [Candidatus Eremiobacteraeota bacterium]
MQLTFQRSFTNLIVRITTFLAAILALVVGPVVGALAAVLSGAGLETDEPRSVMRGPASWLASEFRTTIFEHSRSRLLAALVAVPVGLAVGLLTGPLWFHFISTEAARCLGENVAERMVGALP